MNMQVGQWGRYRGIQEKCRVVGTQENRKIAWHSDDKPEETKVAGKVKVKIVWKQKIMARMAVLKKITDANMGRSEFS